MPEVSMGFYFAGEEGKPTATMIAVKDSKSKACHAYLLDGTGEPNPKITKKLVGWIDDLGYGGW